MDMVQIEAEALKLSEADRAVLVDSLQASLGSKEIAHLDDHVIEAKERLDAYRSGETRSFDGPSFVNSLRNSLS